MHHLTVVYRNGQVFYDFGSWIFVFKLIDVACFAPGSIKYVFIYQLIGFANKDL